MIGDGDGEYHGGGEIDAVVPDDGVSAVWRLCERVPALLRLDSSQAVLLYQAPLRK